MMTDVDCQEPTGRPEEFGLAPREATTLKERTTWDHQEMFLTAYRQYGRITKSAEAVGLTRWAYNHWMDNNRYNFQERMRVAHDDWVDTKMEGLMDARLNDPRGNRGSDVLLMFALKAERPEKYREEVRILDTTPTRDLLVQLRAIGAPRIVDGSVSTIGPSEVSNVPAPPLSVSESEVVE